MEDRTKLDILWKSHKGLAATSENKKTYNEALTKRDSVLLSQIWGDSHLIPVPAKQELSGDQGRIMVPYFGAAAVTLQLDPSSDGRAYVAVINPATPINDANRIKNFIPETFHITYMPKIWNGDPSSPSEELQRIYPYDTGYEWEFDAQAGVLYFANDVSPKVMSETIYLEGYQYIGSIGDIKAVATSVPTFDTITFTTGGLEAGEKQDFTLPTGARCVLAELRVSSPCIVECHSVASYSDTNPYRFSGIEGHLIDDGSYVISGSRFYGERFITLLNLTDPISNSTYWSVRNTRANPLPITLTLKVLV